MTKLVFVDTGAFLALVNSADQFHAKAKKCLCTLVAIRAGLVTSNFVLDETYTRIRRTAGIKTAIAFGEKIGRDRELKIMTVDRGLEIRAWEIFKKFSDHDFSYTDCTSFAMMRKMRLLQAFAFDIDFKIFGFGLVEGA